MMRIDSRPPPIISTPVGYSVRSVSPVHPIRALASNSYEVLNVVLRQHYQHPLHEVVHTPEQRLFTEDRRKVCRRVKHQAVMIELRSGIDRRRHNLRGSDQHDHIDEEA